MQQTVRWKNTFTQDLVLADSASNFEEITDVIVKAGETFEFRPAAIEVLTYKDKTSGAQGSIFVKRLQ